MIPLSAYQKSYGPPPRRILLPAPGTTNEWFLSRNNWMGEQTGTSLNVLKCPLPVGPKPANR